MSESEVNTSLESQNEQMQAAPAKKDKEYNFEQLRKQLEAERKAREEAEERAKQYELSKSSNDEDEDEDDPYIDRRYFSKKIKELESSWEKKMDEKAHARAAALLEQEKEKSYLKEHPDFNDIMNEEVLSKFQEEHPILAESYLRMPEGFQRQKMVYETVKALNIKKEKERTMQDQINQRNKGAYYQPSSMASGSYAAQGDFSPQGRKAAYDKMQELKKRLRLG